MYACLFFFNHILMSLPISNGALLQTVDSYSMYTYVMYVMLLCYVITVICHLRYQQILYEMNNMKMLIYVF